MFLLTMLNHFCVISFLVPQESVLGTILLSLHVIFAHSSHSHDVFCCIFVILYASQESKILP